MAAADSGDRPAGGIDARGFDTARFGRCRRVSNGGADFAAGGVGPPASRQSPSLGGGGFPALPPVGPVCRRSGAGCHRPRSLQSLRSAGSRGRCGRQGRGPFQRKGGPDGRLSGPDGPHPGRDRGDLGGEALQLCPGYRSGFHQDGMQQQRVSRGRQGTGRLEVVGERAVSQGGLPLDHRRGDLPGDVGGGGRGEEAPDQSAGAGTVFAAVKAHAGGAPRRRPAAQSGVLELSDLVELDPGWRPLW